MKKTKIFCLGFSKTGTTSLHQAFLDLGFRSCHYDHLGQNAKELMEKADKEGKKLFHYINDYDAYSDLDLHPFYLKIDKQYPNSKFILSIRNPISWVISRLRHDKRWNKRNPDKPQRSLNINKIIRILKLRKRRHKEIIDYFKGNPNFLIIDVTKNKGNTWKKLCDFLEVPTPDIAFPHENKSSEK